MNTVWKLNRIGINIFKERLVVKGFKTSDAMHSFTRRETGWEYCATPYYGSPRFTDLKPGTYAFAGGKYHNVKSLDASVLAHI